MVHSQVSQGNVHSREIVLIGLSVVVSHVLGINRRLVGHGYKGEMSSLLFHGFLDQIECNRNGSYLRILHGTGIHIVRGFCCIEEPAVLTNHYIGGLSLKSLPLNEVCHGKKISP